MRTGKCSINFIPANKKCCQQAVNYGFPGDTPKEKMKNFKLTPIDGLRQKENPNESFPKILDESIQVFECTW